MGSYVNGFYIGDVANRRTVSNLNPTPYQDSCRPVYMSREGKAVEHLYTESEYFGTHTLMRRIPHMALCCLFDTCICLSVFNTSLYPNWADLTNKNWVLCLGF